MGIFCVRVERLSVMILILAFRRREKRIINSRFISKLAVSIMIIFIFIF